MTPQPLLVLNSSVLLESGTYEYAPIALDDARELVTAASEITSAIGHAATAYLLTRDLGTPIDHHRRALTGHAVGQRALVIKLNGRVPPGDELTVDEIDHIGYQLMQLTRLT